MITLESPNKHGYVWVPITYEIEDEIFISSFDDWKFGLQDFEFPHEPNKVQLKPEAHDLLCALIAKNRTKLESISLDSETSLIQPIGSEKACCGDDEFDLYHGVYKLMFYYTDDDLIPEAETD